MKSSGNKKDKTTSEEQSSSEFLIVGLGASAGGIQALQQFFENTPPASNLAYVVILHLSPDHDSKLAEVLQQTCDMPVVQVTQKTTVQPDHVYVIPPDRHLIMSDDTIMVLPNMEMEDRRAPVDIFFRTLADTQKDRAVCVILSGTGANGSMGLKRIKEEGGAVFVQSPREAEFNEMPRNAIATDLVDDILPVAQIPAKIIAYRDSIGLVEIPVEPDKRHKDQQYALREIFTQLKLRTGHDFMNYKRPTLLRRIERRISIHNLPDLPAYAGFLQQNPDETTALLKDLLISVTNFFRDYKAFDVIETEVLPKILSIKSAEHEDQVRIWVAGCATGEEAYSIAMLLAELTMNSIDAPRIQIFATDIDESAIAHAREGYYTINDAADVSAERLRKFFNKEGDGYRIRREIREMILFANHNFIKDPPFSHLDMITCRNVLIYLNSAAQERVLGTFHFALNPGGFLFLGSSESTDGSDIYSVFNREAHIFQSRNVPMRAYPVPETVPSFRFDPLKESATSLEQEKRTLDRITFSDLHQRLLEQYAPPSVVVNEEYEIVHLSDSIGKYLQFTGGEATQNLLKLIKAELRMDLRSALYQAVQKQLPVEARGLKVNIDEKVETVTIHVRPVLRYGDIAKGFILILFEPDTNEVNDNTVVIAADEPLALQFEEELVRVKAQLRSSIEQHEFQSEELKASNEELQAMNEELRSAAEELETSKEELQSINEELRTVNQELKIKIEETTLSGNNLQNLINSVDIATIFLDRSFRVAMFTPATRKLFNLIPADHGRSLSDITHHLDYPDILKDAGSVLEKLVVIEREVNTKEGHTYMMRLLPYRTNEDRINGVVMTFVEITELKNSQLGMLASELKFRTLTNVVPQLIWTNDINGKLSYSNQRWHDYTGLSTEQSAALNWRDIVHPDDVGGFLEKWKSSLQSGNVFETEFRLRHTDRTYRWFIGRSMPLFDDKGTLTGWFGSATDIDEMKNVQEAFRQSQELLRISLESAVDYAIITLDLNGIITGWSRGAESIFGYTETEVIGQTGSIIFTPEDRAAGIPEKEMEKALGEGKALDERWHLRKDESRFYVSGVMTPLLKTDGISGFVKVARDMTLQKLQEQQKDEFIGIASHELKTPVTSIKIYAELLQDKFEKANDTGSTELMAKLNGQVDRFNDLIRDLLDTTRITVGKLELQPEIVDLNKLIAQRVEEMQYISNAHKLVFNAGELKPVNADRDRISQVLVNLISNAIKYSPAGGEVIITSETTGNAATISIRDHGIGIPQELQPQVFQRFFRITNPGTHTYPGMGLGLYISAGIIARHGGAIFLESKEGEGSVFYFSLPYEKN